MNDLFTPQEAPVPPPPPPQGPAEPDVIVNGRAYSLKPVLVDKVPRWAINWRALDGSERGVVGGWYATPELARAAIEMVATR